MVISDDGMKSPRFFAVLGIVSCAAAKAPSSEPLRVTRLELTLEDGTKPPALTGRAFAIVPAGRGGRDELVVYVFDAGGPEISCTDINVGGWMDRIGQGHVGIVNVTSFPGNPGRYPVTNISWVRGGGGRQLDMRSAPAGRARIELTRWDELFEGTISGPGRVSGTVSGIVCAAK